MEILNGTSMELLAYSVEKCDKMDIYLGSYRILIFIFDPFMKIWTSSKNTFLVQSLFSSMYI